MWGGRQLGERVKGILILENIGTYPATCLDDRVIESGLLGSFFRNKLNGTLV